MSRIIYLALAVSFISQNGLTRANPIKVANVFSLIRTSVNNLPSNIKCESMSNFNLPGSVVDCEIKNDRDESVVLNLYSADAGKTISFIQVNIEDLANRKKLDELFNSFLSGNSIPIKTITEMPKDEQLKYDWSTDTKKNYWWTGADQENHYRIYVLGGSGFIQAKEKWIGLSVINSFTKMPYADVLEIYLSKISKQIAFADIIAKSTACKNKPTRQQCFDKKSRLKIYRDAYGEMLKEYKTIESEVAKLSVQNQKSFSTFVEYISKFDTFRKIAESAFMSKEN